MICNLTVKRITYFLIIRQLRFDKYEDVAMELERSYFNCLRNQSDTLSDLLPSNELERLVFSNYISSQLLSSVQSSLVDMTGSFSVKSTLRKPKQDISTDESFLVYQDAVSIPLKPPTSGINLFSACVSSIARPSKDRKRGRSSESLQMINARPAKSLPDQISNELQEISAELRSNCPSPHAKVNSFLSLAKNDVQNEANLSDVNDGIPPSRTDSCSEDIASENPQFRQLPSSYTQYEISGLATKAKPLSNTHTLRAGTLSPIPGLTLKDSPFLNDCKTTRINMLDQESFLNNLEKEQNNVFYPSSTPSTAVPEVPQTEVLSEVSDQVSEDSSCSTKKDPKELDSSKCEVTETKLPATFSNSSNIQNVPVTQFFLETDIPKTAKYDKKEESDENVTPCDELTPDNKSPDLLKLDAVFVKPTYIRFSDFGKAEDFSNYRNTSSDNVVKSQQKTKSTEKAVQLGQDGFTCIRTCSSVGAISTCSSDSISTFAECNNSETSKSVQSESVSVTSSTSKVVTLSQKPAKRKSGSASTRPCMCGDSPNIAFSLKIGDRHIQARDRSCLHTLHSNDREKIIRILNEGWKVETTFTGRVTKEITCAVGCSVGDILFALFGKKISEYVSLKINNSNHLQVKLMGNMSIKDVIKQSGVQRTNCKLVPEANQQSPPQNTAQRELCKCVNDPKVVFSRQFPKRIFEARDKSSLHKIKYDEKIKILRILAEWTVENAFIKSVTAIVPCAKNCSFEDILYALFGDQICNYVGIDINCDKQFKVRLNASSMSIRNVIKRLDTQNILSRPCADRSEVFTFKFENHTVQCHDVSSLLKLTYDDKIKILTILSGHWKNEKTIEKKVAGEIPEAKDLSLGDILYALLGNKISVYIDMRINKNDNFQVMLKEAYNDQAHFKSIVVM
ncbi:hypothetical protein ACHWQZ_G010856 [Mnemiopsis leidyi]